MTAQPIGHAQGIGTLTEEQFFEQFKPVQNHIDTNAGFDGTLFETFGAELDYVRSLDPRRVATLVEGDDGMGITSGYHHVNRLGYFVRGVAFERDFDVPLEDDGDDDEEDDGEHD